MAKLYFRYSAMNAGKSTALLQVAHNYESQGMAVILYTAKVDNRFGEGRVTSRLGVSREALTYTKDTDFISEMVKHQQQKPACLLVDECQFLSPSQVRELHQVAALKGVPVICYGLRTDFKGKPFEGSSHLLALADDLEELKTVCACGKKATMVIKEDKNGYRQREGDSVSIGDAEYTSVCAKCFYS